MSTPDEIGERIIQSARSLGGCHPIDKGMRRNIGIDTDRLLKRLAAAEVRVAELEATVARIEALLADEGFYVDKDDIREALRGDR